MENEHVFLIKYLNYNQKKIVSSMKIPRAFMRLKRGKMHASKT